MLQIIKTATRITEDSSTSIDLIFTSKVANVMNTSLITYEYMIGYVKKSTPANMI